MLHPAPQARLVVSDEDVVVLDLAADRYLGLPGAIVPDGVTAMLSGRMTQLHPAAAVALETAGLIVPADDHGSPAIDLPQTTIGRGDISGSRISIRDFVDLLIVLAVTSWRLWRRRPCRDHATARTVPKETIDSDVLRQQVGRLDRLRLFLPLPRRCLPSALMTCLWLGRAGIPAEIVFGVRTHPFEAHCWAEHDGMIINDEIDRIRSFIPISVGSP